MFRSFANCRLGLCFGLCVEPVFCRHSNFFLHTDLVPLLQVKHRDDIAVSGPFSDVDFRMHGLCNLYAITTLHTDKSMY